jgi:hypothetical protein
MEQDMIEKTYTRDEVVSLVEVQPKAVEKLMDYMKNTIGLTANEAVELLITTMWVICDNSGFDRETGLIHLSRIYRSITESSPMEMNR